MLELCQAHFDTMLKFVVDIQRHCLSVGGEMHSDGESVLLANGSRQSDLWGGNLYPWNPPEGRIEFTSFINIRPTDDNSDMEIRNPEVRRTIEDLVGSLLLSPEEIMMEKPQ